MDSTAADGTRIADWLEFHTDGRVTLRTGKVDIGTGVLTALAQIAAEELDVAVERIDVVAGHTDRTPDEGYTAGSRTIKEGGAAVRRVAAEARRALLELAAAQVGDDPSKLDDLTVDDGVVTGPRGRRAYAELLGGAPLDRVVTGAAPTKAPSQYRVVGTAVPRPEIARRAFGDGRFISDVRIDGMLHARVVRPSRFGARLLAVDTSDLPPEVTVVRRKDFLAVVAEREDVALAAREAIRATWSEGRPTSTMEELYDWMRRQPTDDQVLIDTGGADGGIVRDFHWPFQAHASVGPSCAVADVRPDGVTVYAAAQGVYPLRRGLALLLDRPEETIEVIHRDGSGCYGHNGADDVAADAALISQELGRPVRVQWTRFDELVWARKGPATTIRIQADLDPDGRVRAWTSDLWTPTHGGRARTPDRFVAGFLRDGIDEPDDTRYVGGERNARVDYDIPAQTTTMHWLRRPALPGSSLRALGATANTFANESMMDELAALAGADPIEFRRRHLSDPRALAVIDAVAAASGWGRPTEPGQGLGFAYARYENVGAYLAAVAEVHVTAGMPRVTRFWIAHDCGLVVNPDGLRNQIEGNVIQSLSRALVEEVRWDDSGQLNTSWETYPILRFTDIPPIEVIIIDRPDQPPVGAGEPATITTAPAVANAIAAATGRRLRRVPLLPHLTADA